MHCAKIIERKQVTILKKEAKDFIKHNGSLETFQN
jgi:hypothetical protein